MFKKLLERVKRSKLFRDSAVTLVSNVINRGLLFLTFLLIARALSVSDYGYLTILLVLINTITDLVNSGLNSSLIRFTARFRAQGKTEKIRRLFSTSFINVTLVSIAAMIAIVLLAKPIAGLFLKGQYSLLVSLSAIGIFGTFYYSLFSALFQGREKFTGLMTYSISFALLRFVPVIILYFTHQLTIGSVLGIFIVSTFLAALLGFFLNGDLKLYVHKYDRSLMKETFGFGKWMVLWAVVAIVQSRLDTYLLSPLASAEQVSYFDMAQKFTSIIMMAAGAYGTVLNPRLAGIKDEKRLKQEVNRSAVLSAVISISLILAIFVFPPLIELIFGGKYNGSIPPLRIMLLSLTAFVFTLPFNAALYAMGHSKVFFFSALGCLIVNTTISLLLVPKFGAIGSSFSFTAVNITSLVFSIFFYRHYIKTGFKPSRGRST